MLYDVVIVGGGPSGLSASLTLGRSRKRVLLCDSGPRRNVTAEQIHNFVTQDGTPPDEFRRIAREQLDTYPLVETSKLSVVSITGMRGAFSVRLSSGRTVASRRVLLCTGMIDESLPIAGFDALWGRTIFQCPYCHGWENQERRWGYLVCPADEQKLLPFALQALSWTRQLVVFTNGGFEIVAESQTRLKNAGIQIENEPVARLVARDHQLQAVEFANGTSVPCDVLFTHPPQRQVELIQSLGVTLDAHGYVTVDELKSETSMPGIYAAGDLTSRMQAAVWAAAAGTRTAAMINADLTAELASCGLP